VKIVKLNNNFKIHRLHRFEVGIKFDMYGSDAGSMCNVAKRLFGHEAFLWEYYPNEPAKGDWATAFGAHVSSAGRTPYWIYLRKTSMLSMVLLSMERKE
jgi:hypothetical protein